MTVGRRLLAPILVGEMRLTPTHRLITAAISQTGMNRAAANSTPGIDA